MFLICWLDLACEHCCAVKLPATRDENVLTIDRVVECRVIVTNEQYNFTEPEVACSSSFLFPTNSPKVKEVIIIEVK